MIFNFPDKESHNDFIEIRDYLLTTNVDKFSKLSEEQQVLFDEGTLKYILSLIVENKQAILDNYKPKIYNMF